VSRLDLRIYLVTLLPFVITALVIGVLDLSVTPSQTVAPLSRWLLPLGAGLVLGAVAATLLVRSLARAHEEREQRVTQLLRAQQELLANVSHELRTPLARIRVALDILDLDAKDDTAPELQRLAADIKELEQLVSSIMMTARLNLEAGQGPASLPLRRERTAARPVLEAAVARFRERNPKRQLEVGLDEPLPDIDADQVLLRRVIDNLLDNGRKYSEADTVLTLRARGERGEPERLVVEVEDWGIGIAPADLEKISRPFFRTDQSRARATGGVGLGLTLSKRIVEAHGGGIEIESERGRGTRVRFWVPAA
jgi:two-component system, OmpR family, sensor kinase